MCTSQSVVIDDVNHLFVDFSSLKRLLVNLHNRLLHSVNLLVEKAPIKTEVFSSEGHWQDPIATDKQPKTTFSARLGL